MSKNKKTSKEYSFLLKEIGKLYKDVRGNSYNQNKSRLVKCYWNIGRMIYDVEQDGEKRAKYGVHLLKRLSKDLNNQFGKGFSERNIEYMRRFSMEYPISQTSAELTWSHYCSLLTLKNTESRKRLEKRAIKEKLSFSKLQMLVRKEYEISQKGRKTKKSNYSGIVKPNMDQDNLYLYKLIKEKVGKNKIFILDCGFHVYHQIKILGIKKPRTGDILISKKTTAGEYRFKIFTDKKSYMHTYKASLERVVDGDTLLVRVDVGFNTMAHQRLRLRGVYVPELGTQAGDEAKKHVRKKIKPEDTIGIQTYGCDRYGRYLADVMYGNEKNLFTKGEFLNQELLDEGLGITKSEMTW